MIKFTWGYIRSQFEQVLINGFEVITVREYFEQGPLTKKFHINRVDIDISIEKAEKLAIMFNSLGIKGTFFVRLHDYNIFSYKNYRILKFIQDSGHEIGLHAETYHQVAAFGGDHFDWFWQDINTLENAIGDMVYSYSNHQDNKMYIKNTGLYDGIYSADKIPSNIVTVTDSEWTKWKVYQHGKKWKESYSISELSYDYDRIYSLIHPCKYYGRNVFDD